MTALWNLFLCTLMCLGIGIMAAMTAIIIAWLVAFIATIITHTKR